MHSGRGGLSSRSLAPVWPWWLTLTLFPPTLFVAVAIGRAERSLVVARMAVAAAGATVITPGTSAGGGGVLLALVPILIDLTVVGLALNALRTGLARHGRMVTPFPLAPLLLLLSSNAACWACSLPLGVVTTWASLMAMALWVFQGPPRYHDDD